MSKGLEALKIVLQWFDDEHLGLDKVVKESQEYQTIEKELKALNEILALHDKWAGHEMSDFEFFTLLSETRDKYDLFENVLFKECEKKDNALKTISDIIRDFNNGEFASSEVALQEISIILRDVLL